MPLQQVKDGLKISASVGVAHYPNDGKNPEELVQFADTAMYSAKKGGRNGYRYFAPHMNEEAKQRQQLRQEIDLALREGQFELYLQPVWDVSTASPCSAEALIRWNHPLRGLLPPSEFIPMAEETGQIVAIGQWVINKAIELVQGWAGRFGPLFRLAVNVSPHQFATRGLLQQLQAQQSALPQLTLEITESVLVADSEVVKETLTAIHKWGGRISIDDFGTGYSSLTYLQRLPVDEIKIDKLFVDGIVEQEQGKALVQAIVGIAQAIGAGLVAEGVELATQARFLEGFAHMHLQGWYVAKPMPCREFEAWMAKPPKPTANSAS